MARLLTQGSEGCLDLPVHGGVQAETPACERHVVLEREVGNLAGPTCYRGVDADLYQDGDDVVRRWVHRSLDAVKAPP